MDGICLDLAGQRPAESSRRAEGADERALIRRAQQGEREAFDALVRLYERGVLRLALRLVRSPQEAQDLYQEAFLKAYRSIGRFRLESQFSTWLYRVVTNVCLDYLRRQKSRSEVPLPESPEGTAELVQAIPDHRPGLNPEQALRAREISRRLQAALAQLSPRERMVFELRHCEGVKLRAIGEMCGSSEEAAKNSLFRATQKLRAQLGDLV